MADALKVRFHHNVIEHLGLRLYQNKPDKVLCELVSNSWDADANNVDIEITSNDEGNASLLVVMDDGIGMSRQVLQDAFLTIAAPRRNGQNDTARSPSGRLLMGRKGLGKLAPFGICNKIDVITGNFDVGFTWIALDLPALREANPAPSDYKMGQYSPTEVLNCVFL